ncbi:MAG: HEXXH motif-containing putative peptide modification protein [Pseudomonadota bacterium]
MATALRKTYNDDPSETLSAQLALVEAASGGDVDYQVDQLDSAFRLRSQGLDYSAGPVDVHIRGETVNITGKLSCPHEAVSIPIQMIEGRKIRMTMDTEWLTYWFDAEAPNPSGADHDAFMRMFDAVTSAIADYAPEYVEWTSLLLKEITPFKCAGRGGSNSSSFIAFPGHIHMSIPYSVPAGVVTLVHECSHQFFHMIEWNLAIVADPNYHLYSILKERQRPLSRILLGYHAFVNALAALALMRERGYSFDDFDYVYEHTEGLVAGLHNALVEVPADKFAPVGLNMFYRLREADHILRH